MIHHSFALLCLLLIEQLPESRNLLGEDKTGIHIVNSPQEDRRRAGEATRNENRVIKKLRTNYHRDYSVRGVNYFPARYSVVSITPSSLASPVLPPPVPLWLLLLIYPSLPALHYTTTNAGSLLSRHNVFMQAGSSLLIACWCCCLCLHQALQRFSRRNP